MARHNPSRLIIESTDQSDIIEQKLAAVCKNLLERPVDRRGPYFISDNELRTRLPVGRLKLAVG